MLKIMGHVDYFSVLRKSCYKCIKIQFYLKYCNQI